jgi:NADP-dependent 3-hydroxy acid dehydrogenase YdfG
LQSAKLVLGARRLDWLEALAATIVEADYNATDVTQRADLTALVALAHERYGRLDVLVINAGIGPVSRFDALCVDDWEAMIDVNIKGVLYGIDAALPVFRQQETAHFINVVSTPGLKILPGQGVYAATKPCERSPTRCVKKRVIACASPASPPALCVPTLPTR